MPPLPVSIHAPVRGATPEAKLNMARFTSFNPRPCARGDTVCFPVVSQIWGFNPRPCARGDSGHSHDSERYRVSIHAPVRGATIPFDMTSWDFLFQSTPLCEGRLQVSGIVCFYYEFQSTPLCEGRRGRAVCSFRNT